MGTKPSLWTLGGLCLAATWGGFALFLWLVVPDAGVAPILAGGFGFGASTTTVTVAIPAVRRYRRQWTDDEWIVVTRTFRTARPPAGTELDERLLATIDRRRVLLRRARRYAPWVYGAVVAVELGNLIAEPGVHSAAGFVGVGAGLAYGLWLPSIRLRRLEGLEAVRQHEKTQPG